MVSRFIALYIPIQESKVLRTIGIWCNRFTPFVGVEEDITPEIFNGSQNRRGLILDITGMHRLFPDERALTKTIFTTLQSRHIPVSIGVAPTIGAAWALSRFGNKGIQGSDTTSLKNQLAHLPVGALRLGEDLRTDLQELGIYTIEDLLSLPVKELVVRFGFQLLKRIDQALGRVEEPIRLMKTKEHITVQAKFAFPISKQESLRFCFLKLLEKLMETLQAKAIKATSFHIKLRTEKNHLVTRNIHLYLASRNSQHISQVLMPSIESIQISEGIVFVSITALQVKPHQKIQETYQADPSSAYEQSLGELVNLYRQHLGENGVVKPVFHSSYIPERSFSFTPIGKDRKTVGSTSLIKDRPSYLLSTPEPIHAISMLPDKPPSWMKWKEKVLRLIDGMGPERISSEWWQDGFDTRETFRDYFKVKAETGELFWVFRDSRTLGWFVHGVWV